ncbi:putative serine racemase [Holothuria leucospilota]|uniref:L-serine deaminase n=1 Tax=Holothuria leucospilota TaxID=206669 RepID=A0A9Q1HHZ2_HOLLE|nr:putative serine racemase [Holothuria leucospilota]
MDTDVAGLDGKLVTLAEIQSAYKEVQSSFLCTRTPLLQHVQKRFLESPHMELFLKLENTQITGSFKVRGLANQIAHIPQAVRNGQKEVITMSAGNYGRAMVFACSKLGLKARVLTPDTAPMDRTTLMESYGATVERMPTSELQPTVDRHVKEEGMHYLHPFDDLDLIAGHASAGIEILEDLPDPDVIAVCCGGGGLVSGISAAVKLSGNTNTRLYCVEPETGRFPTFRGVRVSAFADSLNVRKCVLFKDKTETIFIEVLSENRSNTIIGVVYKPPDGDFYSFNQNISNCLEVISGENKTCFVAGDFNIDLLKSPSSPSAEAFLNTLHSYAFYPTIDKSTRISETSSTLIDNIFTNCDRVYVRSGIMISEISDHYPIFAFSDNLLLKRNHLKSVTYINNTCYKNMAKLRTELSLIDWTIVTNDLDADSAYSKFSEIILNVYQRCCPLIKLNHKINNSKSPWLTTGIFKSIRKKNLLFARFKRSFSTDHKVAYTKYRNILTSVIKNAKKMYYANLLSLHRNDSGKIWEILNNVIGTKKSDGINATFVCNDEVINDNYAVCNGFNEYFASVAQNLSDKLPTSHVNPLKGLDFNSESLVIFPTDSDEVLSSINDLKSGKSPGCDGISNKVLKHVGDVVASPISHIMNLSFSNGVFPSELKIAKIIPIFKSGDKQQFSNYRPVSLLPSVSKLFEHLMYNRISSFIPKHNILTSFQYGFRKGYSTDMAAVNLVDKVSTALDNKLSAIGIFIDLSKAFDTIDHSILLNKLFAYGFRGVSYTWIESYLKNRVQYVHYNANAMYLSFQKGEAASLPNSHSVASGLSPPFAGKHNFKHCKAFTEGVILVSDDEILQAMKHLYERGLVVEPSGAAAFAALMFNKIPDVEGKKVVIVLTGGNVSPEQLHELWKKYELWKK